MRAAANLNRFEHHTALNRLFSRSRRGEHAGLRLEWTTGAGLRSWNWLGLEHLWSLERRGLKWYGLERRDLFAWLADHGDADQHRHFVALFKIALEQHARRGTHHIHHRFVGFNRTQQLALRDAVTDGFKPRDDQ